MKHPEEPVEFVSRFEQLGRELERLRSARPSLVFERLGDVHCIGLVVRRRSSEPVPVEPAVAS